MPLENSALLYDVLKVKNREFRCANQWFIDKHAEQASIIAITQEKYSKVWWSRAARSRDFQAF